MQRLVPIIVGAAILIAPSVAYAVPITVHEKMRVQKEVVDYERVRGDAFVTPKTVMVTRVVEDVIHVPPKDEDDDGIADAEDDCVFCAPPEPVYAESTEEPYSEPSYSSGMPSMVECESGGDPNVYSADGTYWGLGQFDQSTWDAYAPSGEWGSASAEEQIAAINAVPYDAWPSC